MSKANKIRNTGKYNRKQERMSRRYAEQVAAAARRIAPIVGRYQQETGQSQLDGRRVFIYSVLARNGVLGNKVRVVRDEEKRQQYMRPLSGYQQQLIANAIDQAESNGWIKRTEIDGGGMTLSTPRPEPTASPSVMDTDPADTLAGVGFVSSRDELLARQW